MTRDVFADTAYAAAYGRPANERLRRQAYDRPAGERWMHWAACNSVPKAAYDAAGGFDPAMAYREDSELGLRLAQSGVEIVLAPELEIDHRGPAPDTASRAGRAFTSGASTVAFEERHPGSQAAAASGPQGPWDRAVAAAAHRITSRQDAAALGRRVDTLLPRLPARAHGKAIAWAVEASAAAGRRVGDSTWVRDRTASGARHGRHPPLRRSCSDARAAGPAGRPDAPRRRWSWPTTPRPRRSRRATASRWSDARPTAASAPT